MAVSKLHKMVLMLCLLLGIVSTAAVASHEELGLMSASSNDCPFACEHNYEECLEHVHGVGKCRAIVCQRYSYCKNCDACRQPPGSEVADSDAVISINKREDKPAHVDCIWNYENTNYRLHCLTTDNDSKIVATDKVSIDYKDIEGLIRVFDPADGASIPGHVGGEPACRKGYHAVCARPGNLSSCKCLKDEESANEHGLDGSEGIDSSATSNLNTMKPKCKPGYHSVCSYGVRGARCHCERNGMDANSDLKESEGLDPSSTEQNLKKPKCKPGYHHICSYGARGSTCRCVPDRLEGVDADSDKVAESENASESSTNTFMKPKCKPGYHSVCSYGARGARCHCERNGMDADSTGLQEAEDASTSLGFDPICQKGYHYGCVTFAGICRCFKDKDSDEDNHPEDTTSSSHCEKGFYPACWFSPDTKPCFCVPYGMDAESAGLDEPQNIISPSTGQVLAKPDCQKYFHYACSHGPKGALCRCVKNGMDADSNEVSQASDIQTGVPNKLDCKPGQYPACSFGINGAKCSCQVSHGDVQSSDIEVKGTCKEEDIVGACRKICLTTGSLMACSPNGDIAALQELSVSNLKDDCRGVCSGPTCISVCSTPAPQIPPRHPPPSTISKRESKVVDQCLSKCHDDDNLSKCITACLVVDSSLQEPDCAHRRVPIEATLCVAGLKARRARRQFLSWFGW